MFYIIHPERDLTKIPKELGGWEGLGDPGDSRYEKCHENQADVFTIYKSLNPDFENKILIKRFTTMNSALARCRRLCCRAANKMITKEIFEHAH